MVDGAAAGAAEAQDVLLTAARLERAERLARELDDVDPGLADEIAAARHVMARLLREVASPVVLARALAAVADVVLKAKALEHRLSLGDDELAELATRILEEVGRG